MEKETVSMGLMNKDVQNPANKVIPQMLHIWMLHLPDIKKTKYHCAPTFYTSSGTDILKDIEHVQCMF